VPRCCPEAGCAIILRRNVFLCFKVTLVVGILLLVQVLDCTTREMGRKTSRRRAASVMSGMALNELISIRIVISTGELWNMTRQLSFGFMNFICSFYIIYL